MSIRNELKNLNKLELEALGRKFNVELDRRLLKSKLIKQIMEIEGIEEYFSNTVSEEEIIDDSVLDDPEVIEIVEDNFPDEISVEEIPEILPEVVEISVEPPVEIVPEVPVYPRNRRRKRNLGF